MKGFKTTDSRFARSKFGRGRANLDDYSREIGVSMQYYIYKTSDSNDPFGDKADALNDLMNTMIQEDCQKGQDEWQADVDRRRKSHEAKVERDRKSYDSRIKSAQDKADRDNAAG